MLRKLRPSPALVVAVIALLVALTGVAYGVKLAARNSVGSGSIKHGAVRTSDIANQAVNSSKITNGSVKKIDLNQEVLSELGVSGLNPVPSGKTIHGAVGGDFHNFDNTQSSDFGVDVTMPMPAANALTDNDVFVNVDNWQNGGGQATPTTSDTNAGCNGSPGAPTAPAGKVCIYVSGADNAFNLSGYSVLFGTQGSPYGFKLKWDSSGSGGDTFVDGTWAYTAP